MLIDFFNIKYNNRVNNSDRNIKQTKKLLRIKFSFSNIYIKNLVNMKCTFLSNCLLFPAKNVHYIKCLQNRLSFFHYS